MRRWIAGLSRNPEDLADFYATLDELRVKTLERLLDKTEDAAFWRGAVDGIATVRFAVSSALHEEEQRAKRPR